MRRTGNRREVPATAIDGGGGGAMTYWSLMGSLVARMRRLGALPIIGACACVNRQARTCGDYSRTKAGMIPVYAGRVTSACRSLTSATKINYARYNENTV